MLNVDLPPPNFCTISDQIRHLNPGACPIRYLSTVDESGKHQHTRCVDGVRIVRDIGWLFGESRGRKEILNIFSGLALANLAWLGKSWKKGAYRVQCWSRNQHSSVSNLLIIYETVANQAPVTPEVASSSLVATAILKPVVYWFTVTGFFYSM